MCWDSIIIRLKKYKFLSDFLNQRTLIQFMKYVITGLICIGTEFAVLYLLTDHLKWWYIYSNTTAYIAGFWLSFFLNRIWSFKSTDNLYKQLGLYAVLFCFNLLASNVIMFLFTDHFKLHYMVSKIFSTCAITMWNFVIYKKVIYK